MASCWKLFRCPSMLTPEIDKQNARFGTKSGITKKTWKWPEMTFFSMNKWETGLIPLRSVLTHKTPVLCFSGILCGLSGINKRNVHFWPLSSVFLPSYIHCQGGIPSPLPLGMVLVHCPSLTLTGKFFTDVCSDSKHS